ncbi:Hypp4159 [Branchiostoma lanceolatum]|uniref:Hypp4159 protein n=1 Tax=Branchiostoma lanceolatum TaxID=7740 RepID=A0A8K0A4Y5_BRALA|nr:Hypp4159 [Branchiostoma lanceolatum]
MRTLRWMLQEFIVVLLWQGILLAGNTDSMAAKATVKTADGVSTKNPRRSGGRSFEFARRLKQGRAPDMLVQRDDSVKEWSLTDYVVYRRAADRKRRENPPGFELATATGHPDSTTRQPPLNIGQYEGTTTAATPLVSTPMSRCYYYGCSDDDAGPPACYFTLHSRDVPSNVPCVCVCSPDHDVNASDVTTPVPNYSNEYEDYAAALNSRTPRRGDVNNSISVIVFLVIYMFVVVGYLKLTVKWY